MIIVMFDAHKLDISDELKTVLDVLKPHQDKIRYVTRSSSIDLPTAQNPESVSFSSSLILSLYLSLPLSHSLSPSSIPVFLSLPLFSSFSSIIYFFLLRLVTTGCC